MLGLTKKTDYALLALSHLAEQRDRGAIRTREIADRFDIPVELLAKVLQRLAKTGVLASYTGPNGGYELARPAGEISVGSVLQAVEGRVALASCLRADDHGCDQEDHCTIRLPIERLNARVFGMLNAIPVSELVGPASPETVRLADVQIRSRG